ncbi:MAG: hypothetical protein O6499_02795 [Candidatus Dadabacteria bacterium]|nr:hypothetical protein [Candidatus Dadabacteria bacterium]
MIKSFICGILVLLLVVSTQAFAAQPEVIITEVFPNFNDGTFEITGENFDLGPDPLQVTLGNFGNLDIISADANMIVVAFPEGLVDGDYLLTVFSGSGPRKNADNIVTVGAIGPEGPGGPEGPTGSPGGPGPAGADGATGPEGPKGDKGDTGAPGSDGTDGAQGIQGEIGPKGDKGEAGAQGPKGETGIQGIQGLEGVQGLMGDQGIQGEQCDTGPRAIYVFNDTLRAEISVRADAVCPPPTKLVGGGCSCITISFPTSHERRPNIESSGPLRSECGVGGCTTWRCDCLNNDDRNPGCTDPDTFCTFILAEAYAQCK